MFLNGFNVLILKIKLNNINKYFLKTPYTIILNTSENNHNKNYHNAFKMFVCIEIIK